VSTKWPLSDEIIHNKRYKKKNLSNNEVHKRPRPQVMRDQVVRHESDHDTDNAYKAAATIVAFADPVEDDCATDQDNEREERDHFMLNAIRLTR
jgi:hypothetical protein